MPPLGESVKVQLLPDHQHLPRIHSPDDTKCFEGVVDLEWSIGSISNGGYALALVVEACIQFQSAKLHVDPIHVTAHYLRPTLTAPFTICIRTVKTGSGFTNLTAELLQKGIVKIMTHTIFGVNASSPRDKLNLTLNPPSPWARRHPLYSHPSQAIIKPMRDTWKFRQHVKWAEDARIRVKNQPEHPNRTNSSTVGGGSLEWGSWLELTGKDEKITSPALAFLVDIFTNTPSLLPKSERLGLGQTWYPTITLSIEFKNRIPPPSFRHSDRTVGLYSSGNFVTHPQGRHDIYVEVWTAPSNIGEGSAGDSWRDDQICLAVATQMALTLPMEVNEKKGKPSSVKL